MKMWLSIYEGDEYELRYPGRKERLIKDIDWLVPPSVDGLVFFGVDEDGTQEATNAHVNQVCWHTNGTITVECRIHMLRDEYDSVVESARRDGFHEPVEGVDY